MVISKERSYKKRKDKVYQKSLSNSIMFGENTVSKQHTLTVPSATTIIHKCTIKIVVFYFKAKISIMLPAIEKHVWKVVFKHLNKY